MAGPVLCTRDMVTSKNRYIPCPHEAYTSNEERAMRVFNEREVRRVDLGSESKKHP